MTELKPCEARVKYRKEPGGKIYDHKCCLLAPHPGLKHYDPVLLITMGGDRVTHDIYGNDITHSWSPYSNEELD
jgi:hypothetical protein